MSSISPILLPDKYTFADRDSISPEEVISLRDESDWGRDRRTDVWRSAIEQSLATVGVRYDDEKLVGIGFLAGNARHALLCDFTVHPEHRNKGIGAAILDRRLVIADEIGVRYIYTDIAPTNTMLKRYIDLGFQASKNVFERYNV